MVDESSIKLDEFWPLYKQILFRNLVEKLILSHPVIFSFKIKSTPSSVI